MEKKPFQLGIIVGRFQTLHLGHELMINKAVELCDRVGVLIGSSQEARTYKNPFSFEERRKMLQTVFGNVLEIRPLPDIGVGNVAAWGDYVLNTVKEDYGMLPDLLVSGKEARRSNWLDGADGQNVSELYVPKSIDISATKMRDYFISNDIQTWKSFTNPKLWDSYDEMREIVLSAKDNIYTDSI